MPVNRDKTYYCEKCGQTLSGDQFYSSNNLEKYPNDGKFNVCKKCLTMHVDNYDPSTYLWILQEADVPYIPDEWNKLMLSYIRDKKKMTGMSVVGKYLSKMKLKQFKDYRWADTEALQEVADKKTREAMERQGFSEVEIQESLKDRKIPLAEAGQAPDAPEQESLTDATPVVTAEDLGLTEEDVTYLRLKWGYAYKPDEWVKLEQLYNEMMQSYDIQSAGHIDTLKLICKTSLKCNQLIDIGDVEGFQKMSRVYDQLMKSGKFTAAQNKEAQGEFIDSIGELVGLCETQGFIPRYHVAEPKDKVDETLEDMKRYTKTLVTEELNLGNLIENAVKEASREDAAESVVVDDTPDDLSAIADVEREISDQDFEDFEDYKDEEAAADHLLMQEILDEKR